MAAVGVASTCHLKPISIFLIPRLLPLFQKGLAPKGKHERSCLCHNKRLEEKVLFKNIFFTNVTF